MISKAAILGATLTFLSQLSSAQQFYRSQVVEKKIHPRFRPENTNNSPSAKDRKKKKRKMHSRHLQQTHDGHETDTVWEGPTKEVCQRAVNRLKKENFDYVDFLQQVSESADDESYLDESFKFPDSIHWQDLPGIWPLDDDIPYLEWKRIKDVYGAPEYSLWGDEKIKPKDAIQGNLGNCWLISAAMSIAEDPQRIHDIFEIERKNSAGIYATKMWLLGLPVTVIIDDHLPLDQWSDTTRYAKVASDGALWGTILEKSFAKFLGNYEAIDAGLGAHGVEAMTGSPTETFDHAALDDREALWRRLLESNDDNSMITNGTPTGTGSDQDSNADGLPYNHALSVMRVLIVKDDQGEEHRLVEMRNPWGVERFHGDWSDESDRWTDQLREQTDHLEANDGKFYMSFKDYVEQVEFTDFNRDVQGWHHSSFAMFGDDEPVNRDTLFRDNDTKYNIHTLIIQSPVAQKMQLSAHSHHFKHYHGDCSWGMFSSEVFVKRPGDEFLNLVNPGSIHQDVIEIEAGTEYEVTVYTNFVEDDLLPHDWSVVAWTEKELVNIRHKDGMPSGSFFNLELDAETPIPENFGERKEIIPFSLKGAEVFDISPDSEVHQAVRLGSLDSVYMHLEISIAEDKKFEYMVYSSDGDSQNILYLTNKEYFEYSALSFYSQTDWVDIYDEECKEACQGEVDISIWHIEYNISKQGDQLHLKYTMPSSPDFAMEQTYELDGSEVTWIQQIFEGDEVLFEKTSTLIHEEDPFSLDYQIEDEYETIDGDYLSIWESFYYSKEFIGFSMSVDYAYEWGPALQENAIQFLMPSPERFAVKVIDYQNNYLEGFLMCDLSEGATEEETCEESLSVGEKHYELSHSLALSCLHIEMDEPKTLSLCYNRTRETFERTNYFSDGGEQTKIIPLSPEDQPSEVVAIDLTGSINLHYDVYLNFTDSEDDIHMTGFVVDDYEQIWSWTFQSGEDNRLILTSWKDEEKAHWQGRQDGTDDQLDLECDRITLECEQKDVQFDGWTIGYGNMQNSDKMVFKLTDRLNRRIELNIDVEDEYISVSVKEGPYDQEVYSNLFQQLFPHQAWESKYKDDSYEFARCDIVESLDYYTDFMSNYTVAMRERFRPNWTFNATFIIVGSYSKSPLSVIAELKDGSIVYLGCPLEEFSDNPSCLDEKTAFGFNFEFESDFESMTTSVRISPDTSTSSLTMPVLEFKIKSSDAYSQQQSYDYYAYDNWKEYLTFERSVSLGDEKTERKWNFGLGESWWVDKDEDESENGSFTSYQDISRMLSWAQIQEQFQKLNATTYSQTIDLLFEGTEQMSYSQIFRFNETEQRLAIKHTDSEGYDEDLNLMPQLGMLKKAFIYQNEDRSLKVETTSDDLVIKQEIFYVNLQLCIVQRFWFMTPSQIDYFYNVYNEDCNGNEIHQISRTMDVKDGELFEPAVVRTFEEGYDKGYEKGYGKGLVESEKPREYELDSERLEKYTNDFSDWVVGQRMIQSVFSCDSDVRFEQPFVDEPTLFAFWANHDCSDYDLLLNVMFDAETELNLVGYVGASLSSKQCVNADYLGDGIVSCQFDLKANGSNFAILFKGGFHPVFYTVEWVSNIKSWLDTFSWW